MEGNVINGALGQYPQFAVLKLSIGKIAHISSYFDRICIVADSNISRIHVCWAFSRQQISIDFVGAICGARISWINGRGPHSNPGLFRPNVVRCIRRDEAVVIFIIKELGRDDFEIARKKSIAEKIRYLLLENGRAVPLKCPVIKVRSDVNRIPIADRNGRLSVSSAHRRKTSVRIPTDSGVLLPRPTDFGLERLAFRHIRRRHRGDER